MAKPRPSLGTIAVSKRLVTSDQLDECLAIQAVLERKRYQMPIGQILVERGYLEETELRGLLEAQGRTSREGELTLWWMNSGMGRMTPVENALLVRHVGRFHGVTLEQVDECIEIQQALAELGISRQLAAILVDKEYLPRDVAVRVIRTSGVEHGTSPRDRSLAIEAADLAPAPRDSAGRTGSRAKLLFGAIAVELGSLQEVQVRPGLQYQRRLKELGVVKRLGDLLVDRGWMSIPAVRRVLETQRLRFGRLRWVDLASQSFAPNAADRWFGQWLFDERLLGPQQIQECLYILQEMHRMGFSRKTLANVVVDRGFLSASKVADILLREDRPEP